MSLAPSHVSLFGGPISRTQKKASRKRQPVAKAPTPSNSPGDSFSLSINPGPEPNFPASPAPSPRKPVKPPPVLVPKTSGLVNPVSLADLADPQRQPSVSGNGRFLLNLYELVLNKRSR